jgi:hypothetical protein
MTYILIRTLLDGSAAGPRHNRGAISSSAEAAALPTPKAAALFTADATIRLDMIRICRDGIWVLCPTTSGGRCSEST